MKASSKGKKRLINLAKVFGLTLIASVLLCVVRTQRMRTHLDRALCHPSWMTRLDSRQKFTFWRTGSEPSILDDEETAPIEKERRLRLNELLSLLEGGHLTRASEKGKWIVAATLDDSYDHQNIMRAARAIRLFARLEKEQGLLADSPDSVFPTILYRGLIQWCYGGSWCVKANIMHWAYRDGDSGPSYQETWNELRALSGALSLFGPEATEIVKGRLKRPRGGDIRDESSQLRFVLNLLDGTYARYPETEEVMQPSSDRSI